MTCHDRHLSGSVAYHTGRVAEDSVARVYRRAGYRPVAERWRGQGGELDLVFRDGRGFVFVEVKAARDWARAAERITRRQIGRIQCAAQEFLAATCDDPFAEMRFDAALVDGQGRVDVIENAFM